MKISIQNSLQPIGRNNCLLLILLFVVPLSAYSETLQKFPGSKTELRSPDGQYAVENIDSDKEPHHSLQLKNNRTGVVRPLCHYVRNVSVLWSPDSKKLVVNDYAGSDFSKSLVFFVDQNSPALDIGAELFRFLKDSSDKRSLADNHHVYFAASKWKGPDTVNLKVWGYGDGDPKGFTQFYEYSMSGYFRRVSKHE